MFGITVYFLFLYRADLNPIVLIWKGMKTKDSQLVIGQLLILQQQIHFARIYQVYMQPVVIINGLFSFWLNQIYWLYLYLRLFTVCFWDMNVNTSFGSMCTDSVLKISFCFIAAFNVKSVTIPPCFSINKFVHSNPLKTRSQKLCILTHKTFWFNAATSIIRLRAE